VCCLFGAVHHEMMVSRSHTVAVAICTACTVLCVVAVLASKGFGRAAGHQAHMHARIARGIFDTAAAHCAASTN
jgi:hypothetical protein